MNSFNSEAQRAGRIAAEAAAAEVRAEMGRQDKSKGELAHALGVTLNTAKSRYDGTQPYDLVQLVQVALWLNVPIDRFVAQPEVAAS